jgi:hypothetical protein
MKRGALASLFDLMHRLPRRCGGPDTPATFGTPVTCSATCDRYTNGADKCGKARTESAGCLVVVACPDYLPRHQPTVGHATPDVWGDRVSSATGRVWKREKLGGTA